MKERPELKKAESPAEEGGAKEKDRHRESLQDILKEVQKNSRFQIEDGKEGRILISKSGERYLLNRIESGSRKENVRSAKEIRTFLGNFFDPQENDPEIDYVRGIERGLSDFFVVKDEEGKIVAILNSQLAGLEARQGPAESELIIWYVVTDPDRRGKGIATELYSAAYEASFNKIEKENAHLLGIVGETDPDVEGYLNKMGRKRAYYEDEDGNFIEIPYKAAPSDEDENPTEEHFMVRFVDGRRQCATVEFLRIVQGIYNQYVRPEYFEEDSEQFKNKYKKLMSNTYSELEAELGKAKGGIVYLLSAEERKEKKRELQKEKKEFIEMEI